MNKTKKKKSDQKWLVVLMYMLIGGTAAVLNMRYIRQFSSSSPMLLMAMFVPLLTEVYVAMLGQIILHEGGHLVFGLLTGYRFCSFRVHNWMWIKEEDRIRFTRLSIPGTGGQCLMGPPDLKEGKMPVLLYNLGGVLANLFTAVLFLFLAAQLSSTNILRVFLQLLGLFGIGTALTNGLPLRVGPVDNDGRNVLSLLRSKKAVRAFWIQMKTSELTSRGVRLKDMPEEWFAQADDWFSLPGEDEYDNSLTATVGVLTANRLLDQHRFDEADALMGHLLRGDSQIIEFHRILMVCDRLFLELIGPNREETVRSYLSEEQKQGMNASSHLPSVIRTEYALALLQEKDSTKAERIKERFEKCALTYPYPSELKLERELMQTALNSVPPEEENPEEKPAEENEPPE